MRTTLLIGSLLFSAIAAAAQPVPIAIHSRHVLDMKTGTASDAFIVVRGETKGASWSGDNDRVNRAPSK